MVTFGHTSDWHLGRRHMNLSERYLDNFRAVKSVVRQAQIQEIDFMIHAGDLFEHDSPSARTFNLTFKLLDELKEANIPIYVIRGNHDASTHRLDDNALHVLEHTGIITLIENDIISFEISSQPFTIYGIGYSGTKYFETLRKVIEKHPLEEDHFNILLMHASVSGLKYSDGRSQLNDEDQSHFAASNLMELGFNYIGLGHHHRTSVLEQNNSAIAYSGATEHWNKANWDQTGWSVEKNWLKIAVNVKSKKSNITAISFPVRPKHKSEFDWSSISAEAAINRTKEVLAIASKHNDGIFDYLAYLGFNQIEENNPFFEWRNWVNNLLIKGCVFRFLDKEISQATFNALSEEEIIENYLDNNYKEKKDFFSDLIKKSLLIYTEEHEKDDRIFVLKKYLEEKLNVKD